MITAASGVIARSVQNERGSGGPGTCAIGGVRERRNVSADDTPNAIVAIAIPPRSPTAAPMAPANGEARIVPKKNAPYTIPSSPERRARGVSAARCALMSGSAALPIQYSVDPT